jgi:hypothetical protein
MLQITIPSALKSRIQQKKTRTIEPGFNPTFRRGQASNNFQYENDDSEGDRSSTDAGVNDIESGRL